MGQTDRQIDGKTDRITGLLVIKMQPGIVEQYSGVRLTFTGLCMFMQYFRHTVNFITGPPTSSVGDQSSNGRWRLSSSVTLHCGSAGGFTRAVQVRTSCRLQCNYSSTAARRASSVTSR